MKSLLTLSYLRQLSQRRIAFYKSNNMSCSAEHESDSVIKENNIKRVNNCSYINTCTENNNTNKANQIEEDYELYGYSDCNTVSTR